MDGLSQVNDVVELESCIRDKKEIGERDLHLCVRRKSQRCKQAGAKKESHRNKFHKGLYAENKWMSTTLYYSLTRHNWQLSQ